MDEGSLIAEEGSPFRDFHENMIEEPVTDSISRFLEFLVSPFVRTHAFQFHKLLPLHFLSGDRLPVKRKPLEEPIFLSSKNLILKITVCNNLVDVIIVRMKFIVRQFILDPE